MSKPASLEARIKTLEDIEAIKRLKCKYWRCLDRKLWNELAECFTEDAVADYGPRRKCQGRKAIIQFLKQSLGQESADHPFQVTTQPSRYAPRIVIPAKAGIQ